MIIYGSITANSHIHKKIGVCQIITWSGFVKWSGFLLCGADGAQEQMVAQWYNLRFENDANTERRDFSPFQPTNEVRILVQDYLLGSCMQF